MLVDAHVHCFVWEEFPPGERWAFANNWAWYRGSLNNLSGGRGSIFVPPIDKKGPWRDASKVFPRVGQKNSDPDGSFLMNYLDAMGIEKCVCLLVDWGVAWGEEAEFPVWEVNKRGGELKKKFEGRFYFQAAVDPRRRAAVEIAETAIKDYGASGIKILAANGIAPDDPLCYPLYDLCRSYDKTVTVHTGSGDVAGFSYPAHVWHLEQPAKMFPTVQFVAAHGGGGLDGEWRDIIQMTLTIPNIAIELSEWQYPIAPNDWDPGREQEFIHVLNILRKNLGPHNILIGTDFMGGESPEYNRWWWDLFRDLPARGKKFGYLFLQEEADMIGGDNARRIYEMG